MFEQKRLGDNGTSPAMSKESGDRGDEMDEKDGQVAHRAIVAISTSVTRLGYPQDLCDKSEIRYRQALIDGKSVTTTADAKTKVSKARAAATAKRASALRKK